MRLLSHKETDNAGPYFARRLKIFIKTYGNHFSIELSSLMTHFLNASPENTLTVKVRGKRKREVGLVVPAKYQAVTKSRRIADVLLTKLKEKKERREHFEFILLEEEMVIREQSVTSSVVNISW